MEASGSRNALEICFPLGRLDGCRAWKTFDWDTMERLQVKGMIKNSVPEVKSVVLTEAGPGRPELPRSADVDPNRDAADDAFPAVSFDQVCKVGRALLRSPGRSEP